MSEARAIAAITLSALMAGPAHATHCVSPKATVAILRGQVVHLAEGGSGPVAAGIRIKLERWAAYDVKAVVTDQTDQQGRFEFLRLAPGLYALSFGESGELGHVIIQLDRQSTNRWLRVEVGEQGDRLCSPTKAFASAKQSP